ncbi:MAG: DUF3788 family protein [Eubacteriales bacterium]|nr:DUF3788 family protein [Eubacteriales bacterium]
MLEKIPEEAALQTMVGDRCYCAAHEIRAWLAGHYDLEAVWDKGWNGIPYQCRYRRGGKTLCNLLYQPGEAHCLVVFGAKEREKVQPALLSPACRDAYETANTFHDGRWVWFSLLNDGIPTDVKILLPLKRRLMR